MNIIILGAGQVGSTLAENLTREENDITIVDINEQRLQDLQERMDIRTVRGAASYPSILIQAGIEDADMLIAVTSSDETNLVACQIAYHLFNTPMKIARIRSKYYLEYQQELLDSDVFAVDFSIAPEQIVTDYVGRLIDFPGALQVLDFANNRLIFLVIKPYFGGVLVGKTLASIKEYLPGLPVKIVGIFRGTHSVPLTPSTVIEIGDEVFLVVANTYVRNVLSALRQVEKVYKRIMIAGGGNIGERLAITLEKDYEVKLIEFNPARAMYLAETLNKTIILQGDAADRDLLLNENIDYTDVFIAVTDDDEVNIMSCLLAKRMGARQVIALIAKQAYVDLVEESDIDIAISPQQTTIGTILAHVRRGDIVRVHSLRRGAAETIEAIVHGDRTTSRVVGRMLKDIKLPKGASISAIVRQDEVIIPEAETVIETGDHVIVFVTEKKYIEDIERMFAVDVTFF